MTIVIPRLDRSTAADRGITLADFLVPVGLAEMMNARARHIVLILAGTLFIILTTQVHIAIEPVPITGQTFGVLVAGCALGFRRGATAVALYVLIGAIGLPVFAENNAGCELGPGPIRRLHHRLHRRGRPGRTPGRTRLGSPHRWLVRRDDPRRDRHLRDRAAVADGRRRLLVGRHDPSTA